MATRIVIRHLGGSKINQVEQFPLDAFAELTIGREPGMTIRFDAQRDDIVSRRHAVITVDPGDPPQFHLPQFHLKDLDSSNGTLLNGSRITGPSELLPGDEIELGSGGPKFSFDLDPRPERLSARTRMIGAGARQGTTATRMIDAAGPSATTATLPPGNPTRSTVGRNTVMGMLSEQRRAQTRIGMYALAAVLVIVGAVAGALYLKNQHDVAQTQAQQAAAAQRAALAEADAQAKAAKLAAQIEKQRAEIGLSPEQVAAKYGNSTVWIQVQWRLYDRETGKPLFHKTVEEKGVGLVPAYVEYNGKLYRWLTTEDENHTNHPVGAAGTATGFVVSKEGLIFTNKHVAAGWLIDYNQFAEYEKGNGLYFQAQTGFFPQNMFYRKNPGKPFDVSTHEAAFKSLMRWQPEEGGLVFANSQPVIIGRSEHEFEGRDEQLLVRFPNTRVDVAARLVRASTDADAALIKIDTTEPLQPIPYAPDDTVNVGERVVVLGYPNFTPKTVAVVNTLENLEERRQEQNVPEPTVASGIISNIELPMQQVGNVTIGGQVGNVYQTTVVSGPGNSGGPMLNAKGQAVGLFTYASVHDAVTYAVPIKYARDLLQMQQQP